MKTAVLGLGLIGEIWARHWVNDGLEVQTWNRTPKAFPGFKATAAEAAAGAEVILVVVSDPAAVESVIQSILPVLKAGQTVVQSSTVSAEWNQRYAAAVQATGAAFVEAPFTGSKPAAEARKTVFYTGGDEADIAKVRPALEKISQRLIHIGTIGAAATLKLAMNLNIAGVMQVLSESLSLARAHGITDEVYFEALSINAGRSGLSDLKQPGLRAGDYSPMFALKHMEKDLRLTLETAGDLPLEVTRKVKAIYEQGLKQSGWAEEDFSGLIRLIR